MPSLRTPASSISPARQDVPTPVAPPGIWRRMACWLYEGLLLFAVVFVAGWLFSTLGQMRDAMDARRPLLQAFLFVVFGIYFTVFWSRGQTLAMKTWRLRLVDRNGRPLTQGRALVRYLLGWLWFLPPLAAIHALPFKVSGGEVLVLMTGWVAIWALLARFHPQQQFWHDAWAGTRIVDASPIPR
ncbi:MAG: RDD family protein [Pseudacidovorax sp.]|nr:RDD family protein [Pseudacidovorax sp.]|eukprot:TRINITY_DN44551_c0_g1_i1.p1 TRINITY_DN44551_c0_g1~~TRINITY_DN44551_c0_g1_i1.p1  ORF type:complete len:185 (-),score=17.62 TRINITY_DN44551_c0_g1_i1:31-585(-)